MTLFSSSPTEILSVIIASWKPKRAEKERVIKCIGICPFRSSRGLTGWEKDRKGIPGSGNMVLIWFYSSSLNGVNGFAIGSIVIDCLQAPRDVGWIFVRGFRKKKNSSIPEWDFEISNHSIKIVS